MEIEKYTGIKININSHYKNIIEKNNKNLNAREILNNYKSSMYSDRERKVYKILEAINIGDRKLDSLDSNMNLYYLENIDNLWEHMLKIVLDDEYYNFNNYFPKGRYKLNISNEDYNILGLRVIPDIIKEYKNKLYIIDAKNYQPHIKGNMPRSKDINKQILYKYFLSKEFNDNNKYYLKDIVNIFLLPNDLNGNTIECLGKHRFINVDNEIGDIYIYQIDFNKIVDSYLNNDEKTRKIILNKIMK